MASPPQAKRGSTEQATSGLRVEWSGREAPSPSSNAEMFETFQRHSKMAPTEAIEQSVRRQPKHSFETGGPIDVERLLGVCESRQSDVIMKCGGDSSSTLHRIFLRSDPGLSVTKRYQQRNTRARRSGRECGGG